MDNPWDFALYNPSSGGPTQFVQPSPEIVDDLAWRIEEHTRWLIDHPHNPVFWDQRGNALQQLGYPELAAGDYYKTILLVNASMDYSSTLGLKVRLQYWLLNWLTTPEHPLWYAVSSPSEPNVLRDSVENAMSELRRQAYRKLFKALENLRATADIVSLCQLALRMYPGDEMIMGDLRRAQSFFLHVSMHTHVTSLPVPRQLEYLTYGFCFKRQYPWTESRHRTKPKYLKKIAAEKIWERSNGRLMLQNATREDKDYKINTIFSTKRIKQGEIVYSQTGPIGVSCNQLTTQCFNCFSRLAPARIFSEPCCKEYRYCSKDCLDLAFRAYHRSICGKDLRPLYDNLREYRGAIHEYSKTKSGLLVGLIDWVEHGVDEDEERPGYTYTDTTPLMLARLFAICLKADLRHPLDTSIISSIDVKYQGSPVIAWTLQGNLIGPIEALQAMGVDIFADLRYDTWVIQTLWHRMKLVMGNAPIDTLNNFTTPLSHLFPHSCTPNLMYVNKHSSTWELRATQNIRKHEQISVSHVPLMPLKERQKQLEVHLGEGNKCDCKLCRMETSGAYDVTDTLNRFPLEEEDAEEENARMHYDSRGPARSDGHALI